MDLRWLDTADGLERLVEWWFGSPGGSLAKYDVRRAHHLVPRPLQLLYESAAIHPRLFAQNYLVPVEELQVEEGKLIFYVENQRVQDWATLAADSDQPVWIRENGPDQSWIPESEPMSRFVFQVVLLECLLQAPAAVWGVGLPRGLAEVALRELSPLPLRPWRFPVHPSQFYARGPVIAMAHPSGRNEPESLDVLIAARSAADLAVFNKLAREWPKECLLRSPDTEPDGPN